MARFLITGGAGFIGSHLAEKIFSQDNEVVVLDDLSTGLEQNISPDAQLIVGDIRDNALLDRVLDKVDGCFHLAAIASVQQYRTEWDRACSVNLLGSVQLMNAAAKANVPVVYASSAAIYGDNPAVPLSEQDEPRPISGYGADKLGMEHHAKAMSSVAGFSSVGLRFFNVFGPRQQPGSPYSGVISIFLDRLSQGRPVTIFGDGTQSRDFVYVGDVADALIKAMGHAQNGRSGVWNVCGGTSTTIHELAKSVAAAFDRDVEIQFEAARAGDIHTSLGNPTVAIEQLGFKPQISLQEGLRRTAVWFQERR